jgi:putative resolvase
MATAKFVPASVAESALGVCQSSLRQWSDAGLIKFFRTLGGKYRYLIESLIHADPYADSSASEQKPPRQKICYCTVSSAGQKSDLDRQVRYMQEKHPGHTIIKDVGLGINFRRKGLQTILELSFRGVEEVVVAYRDRLCRFAFELLAWIFQKHGVRLVVLDDQVGSGEDELSKDLMVIVQVFCCRANGKRKYSKIVEESGPDQGVPERHRGNDTEEVVRIGEGDVQCSSGGPLEEDSPEEDGGLVEE